MTYETVIGLEVHCQLKTQSKLFCGCSTAFGAEPNHHTCPVCLGMPGSLPVINRAAVELTIRVGAALGCAIQDRSVFARKNYFYPDLAKGYQVSQYDRPICEGGGLKGVRLNRIHMEEDAGKTIHATGGSFVDFNRAGTPLMEIVTEPDITSADQATEYLKELRAIVRYLDASDGHMEQGSFRCDANVSIRPAGKTELGTRVELKNLNSFNHIKKAIEYEVERQAAVLEGGNRVVQETRLWDEKAGRSRSMRSKEEAHDYRYFPEPDLLQLVVPEGLMAEARAGLPELPQQRRQRYEALGLSPYDADVLTSDQEMGNYFDMLLGSGAEAKLASNWVTSELRGHLNADGLPMADSPVSAADLGVILQRVASGRISGKLAKKVFGRVYAGEKVDKVLSEIGEQVTDTGALGALVDGVIAAHPKEVETYRGGKQQLLGFLIGKVMAASRGRANPQLARQVLLEKLNA